MTLPGTLLDLTFSLHVSRPIQAHRIIRPYLARRLYSLQHSSSLKLSTDSTSRSSTSQRIIPISAPAIEEKTKLSEVPPDAWVIFRGTLSPLGEIPPLPSLYPPTWVSLSDLNDYYPPLLDRGWWLQSHPSHTFPATLMLYPTTTLVNRFYIRSTKHRIQFVQELMDVIQDCKPFDQGYDVAYNSDGLVDIYLVSPTAIRDDIEGTEWPGLTLADLRAAHKISKLYEEKYVPLQNGIHPRRGPLQALPSAQRAKTFIERFASGQPFKSKAKGSEHWLGKPLELPSGLRLPSPPKASEIAAQANLEFDDEVLRRFYSPLFNRGWQIAATTQGNTYFDQTGHMNMAQQVVTCIKKTVAVEEGLRKAVRKVLDVTAKGPGARNERIRTRLTWGNGRIVVAMFTLGLTDPSNSSSDHQIGSLTKLDFARTIHVERVLSDHEPPLIPYINPTKRYSRKAGIVKERMNKARVIQRLQEEEEKSRQMNEKEAGEAWREAKELKEDEWKRKQTVARLSEESFQRSMDARSRKRETRARVLNEQRRKLVFEDLIGTSTS